ncbi:MAG: Stp1/IreP family PP2C-type Ser/Thr phosphatase [Myxococcales bacterium]|nr:Stp1/IreP family PP2C-type Ser/Thr phosphatase [Myxococcales bacterium]
MRIVDTVAFGLTDVGRRRLSNEDAYLIDDSFRLYVVADGMGGHNAGEVASEQAVDTLHGMVRSEQACLQEVADLPEGADRGNTMPPSMRKSLRVMESAVQAATYMVFGLGEANPEQKGMGTTMSALVLRGGYALTAQVGDSRIYLVRDGHAEQITEDHTLVAWQIKKGLITEEEARHSRQKNVITRAVGSREYVQVDTRAIAVKPGDRFLLCSDGLHGYLEDREITDLMAGTVQEAATRAVDIANKRGGRDNITAVVVDIVA